MHAGERSDKAIFEWHRLDESALKNYATRYVGWATTEMGDPETLAWNLEMQFPLSDFGACQTDWMEYRLDEVVDNPQYPTGFEDLEYHTPIVVSIEDGGLIIWDGWHRISCAIARGDECIMTIVGRTRET